jgi:tetratricopeptide (TPR) repeat protein
MWSLALLLSAIMVVGCANKYTTSGKIAYNRKDFDKAIEDFKLALQNDSSNAEAYLFLGKAYKEKNDYVLMARNFDKAEALNPGYKGQIDEVRNEIWTNQYNAGLSDAKADKFDQALKEFQTAIAIEPNKYNPYALVGYAFLRLNNGDSAYIYYQKAYELNRNEAKPDPKLLEGFALMAFNSEKYSKADSLYSQILDLDPNNAEAWLRRGEIADHDTVYDQAVTYYNKSLAIKQDQCDVWFNLGVIYFQHMNKNEEAEQAFTRASDLCPTDTNALVNLSVVLIEESKTDPSKLDLAIEKLTAMTQSYPKECVGWDLLSQAYLRKGDKVKALDANKQYEACKQGQ